MTTQIVAHLLLYTPPKTPKVDLLSVWVHPQWSGVWCEAKECPWAPRATYFRLLYAPERCATTSLAQPRDETMHSGLKLHFMSHKRSSPKQLEFRFGTYLSLPDMQRLHPDEYLKVGLWNANECDAKRKALEGMALLCLPVQVQNLPPKMYTPQHWSPAEHYEALAFIGDFLQDTLCACDQHAASTQFSNLRSYARDYGSCALFPDMYRLYHTSYTTLPPVFACYLLQNALQSHNMACATLMELLRCEKEAQSDKHGILLLLRVLRDVLVGWTMCRYEGKYMADRCCGKNVEDQPHKLSFNECCAGLVGWDDCEGFNQFIQHVCTLFKCMAQAERSTLSKVLQATWDTLFVGTAQQEQLMQLAVGVGEMLQSRRVEAHMSVGSVCFAQFGKATGAELPHSYGILVYHHPTSGMHAATVLEATGWESQTDVMAEPNTFSHPLTRSCTLLTQTQEAHVYTSTIVLNNRILFGSTTERTKGLPWEHRRLGVTLEELKKGCSKKPRPGAAVGISTLELLRHFALSQSAAATKALHLYEKALKSYKELAQWERPPMKSEQEILLYMRNNFGKLQPTVGNDVPPCVLFSCLKEDENKVLRDMAQSQYLQTLDVRAHDFMRSVIFVGTHHHHDG